MRKVHCLSIVAGLAAAALAASPVAARAQQATIETGRLSGVTEAGVTSWKGVPFAAPPVGPLRWRAPQPAARWSGVRPATAYAADCMQLPFPSDAAPLGTQPAEDCLYANVWKPAGAKSKLPVIVWIYGGGFVNGGSSPPTYTGANLARQGVMVVSFNYRLGRFGSFAHPALTQAAADGSLFNNYGYMDQLAGLKWVQRNVAAFGGDPANVTIMGESAGGMSVHALYTSPLAKGLFQKAIIMSGGDAGLGGAPQPTLAAAEAAGATFAAAKGVTADDPEALTKLRALPGETVIDGLNLGGGRQAVPPTYAAPFADGVLAINAGAAYTAGDFARLPLMIGATSGDIGGKTGVMVAGGRKVSAAIADKGAPVYAYRFSYVAESLTRPTAGHASDIPFFMDTQAIKYGEQTTARDNATGGAISRYVVNFARSGDPNAAGLPAWPRYDRAADQIMDFAATGQATPQKDPWGDEIDAAQARPAAD